MLLLFQEKSTPYILDCNEYRTFWVKWETNAVAVGKGSDVNDREIISFTDPDIQMTEGIVFMNQPDVLTTYQLVDITG